LFVINNRISGVTMLIVKIIIIIIIIIKEREREDVQNFSSLGWCLVDLQGNGEAAQEQALSTNAIGSNMYRLPITRNGPLCGSLLETFGHLTSSCSFLVQREYKKRHDRVYIGTSWR